MSREVEERGGKSGQNHENSSRVARLQLACGIEDLQFTICDLSMSYRPSALLYLLLRNEASHTIMPAAGFQRSGRRNGNLNAQSVVSN